MQSSATLQNPSETLHGLEALLHRHASGHGGEEVGIAEATLLIQNHFSEQNETYPARAVLETIHEARRDYGHSQGYLLATAGHWQSAQGDTGERELRNGRMMLTYSPKIIAPFTEVPLTQRALTAFSNSPEHHDKARIITADDETLAVTVFGGEMQFPHRHPYDARPLYEAFPDPGTGTKSSYRAAAEGRHVTIYASADHGSDGHQKPLRIYLPAPQGGARILRLAE